MAISLEQRISDLEARVDRLESPADKFYLPEPGPFRFSSRSATNMQGVHPNLVACAFYALRTCDVDFGIPTTGGVRSAEMQRELVQKGASRTMNSRHRYGLALDIYAYVGGKASWAPEHVMLVHEAIMHAADALELPAASINGRMVRLRWGGDWDMDGVTEYGEGDLVHHEIPREVLLNDAAHVAAPRVKEFLTHVGYYTQGNERLPIRR